jgi:hypothetical protein
MKHEVSNNRSLCHTCPPVHLASKNLYFPVYLHVLLWDCTFMDNPNLEGIISADGIVMYKVHVTLVSFDKTSVLHVFIRLHIPVVLEIS